jgi:alcohol dehydrogenase class IV
MDEVKAGMTDAAPRELRHQTPAFRTYAGPSALSSLRREVDRTGSSRVALVMSPSLLRHVEPVARLRDVLDGVLVGDFTSVEEHSPLPAVRAAQKFLRDAEADAVVALGGGSALVTARASAILLAEDRDVRELCTRREAHGQLVSPRLLAEKLPLWVVPTTPTTAYAKAGSAVRDPDTGDRLALFDPKTRAQGVFLDPGLAQTAPVSLVRSASLNALAMSVEGLRSEGHNPFADALLAQSLRMALHWLPRLASTPDEAHPRLQLMLASLLAGQGSDHVPGGLAQGLSHAVGPRSSVANGVVEAMFLPATTRRSITSSGFPLLGQILRAPGPTPYEVADALEVLLSDLGLPQRLRDVDVDKELLEEIAHHASMDWVVATGPDPATADEILELLRRAW